MKINCTLSEALLIKRRFSLMDAIVFPAGFQVHYPRVVRLGGRRFSRWITWRDEVKIFECSLDFSSWKFIENTTKVWPDKVLEILFEREVWIFRQCPIDRERKKIYWYCVIENRVVARLFGRMIPFSQHCKKKYRRFFWIYTQCNEFRWLFSCWSWVDFYLFTFFFSNWAPRFPAARSRKRRTGCSAQRSAAVSHVPLFTLVICCSDGFSGFFFFLYRLFCHARHLQQRACGRRFRCAAVRSQERETKTKTSSHLFANTSVAAPFVNNQVACNQVPTGGRQIQTIDTLNL